MSDNIHRSHSSPLFVPDALKFYVNRLSFSKNRVRLQALSSQRATVSSQIIVRLPSNTMVNLASLTMTGGVRATLSNPEIPAEHGVALPTNYDFSFIETLSLIANGGIITQPFINYKLLGNALNDVYGDNAKVFSRNGLQGSLPPCLRTPDRNQGGAAQDPEFNYQPFSINNWISATQTMAPSYISTNLLGDLELRLTMTDASIIATGSMESGAHVAGLQQKAGWDMNNINFFIETAAVNSDMLTQAIQAKLQSGEPINVPFENVFSFSQTNDGSTFNQRFSVSSQSVNKIVAITQLADDLNGAVFTTNAAGDVNREPNARQYKYINGVPSALRRNYARATQAQFSINNQYSPNYQINSELNAVNPLVPVYQVGTAAVVNVPANYQMSNALVETRAAMDIPDYDYDCADKLTTTTQMPFEFLGGGITSDTASGLLAANTYELGFNNTPGSDTGNGLLLNPGAGDEIGEADGYLPLASTYDVAGPAAFARVDPDQPNIQFYGPPSTLFNVSSNLKYVQPPSSTLIAPPLFASGNSLLRNQSAFWFPYTYQSGIDTYLSDKYLLATSFDLDVCDKDRLISGVNTLGSNAQMFLNVVGNGSDQVTRRSGKSEANVSSVFVLCTSMVQIYQGATLKIVQ